MDTLHCISNETWERYAKGTLGDAELFALQNHADTCELCADIKEGIDLMAHPEMLSKTVQELTTSATTLVAKHPKESKKRLAPLWYWSAAAMLLLVVGAGWWMVTSEPASLADKTLPKPTEQRSIEEKVEKKDQPVTINELPLNSTKKYNEENIGEKTPNPPPPTDALEKGEVETLKKIMTDEKEVSTLEEFTHLEGKKMSLVDTPLPTPTQPNNAVLPTKKDLPSSIFNNNTELNNNSFSNSWDFGDGGNSENSVDSLTYQTAVQQYSKKYYDSCTTSLEPIITNNQSKYYEDALLLKAQILIDQNNITEAKSLLKSIAAMKKKRWREAKSLLGTLK